MLDDRNFLHWMQDLENILHIKTLSQSLTRLAMSRETIVQQIQEAATREVENAIVCMCSQAVVPANAGQWNTHSAHQTIFRGNNVFTKTMERCLTLYGSAFLEISIGSAIRKLITEKVVIEVDPGRSGKPSKDVAKNVDLLISWCKEIWEQIFAARESCPKQVRKPCTSIFSWKFCRELCALLCTIRNLVEEHSRRADLAAEMQQQRPWQSVSAFIFLRFLVPGILHPHLFGLCSGVQK